MRRKSESRIQCVTHTPPELHLNDNQGTLLDIPLGHAASLNISLSTYLTSPLRTSSSLVSHFRLPARKPVFQQFLRQNRREDAQRGSAAIH
jgi:hypothetical protein